MPDQSITHPERHDVSQDCDSQRQPSTPNVEQTHPEDARASSQCSNNTQIGKTTTPQPKPETPSNVSTGEWQAAADSKSTPSCAAPSDQHTGSYAPRCDPQSSSNRGEPTAPPNYQLVKKIGEGGMGVVYEANHVHLDRRVALKFIRGGAWAGPQERERFLREARAVAKIDHPNVVRVFDAGTHDGHDYCAFEFIAGGSLADRLKGKPRPIAEAVNTVLALAEGLRAVHELGLVHRDIKPGNVLIPEKGTPKLADFGLARTLAGEHLTLAGMVVGTPSYMAPEQATGEEVGPPADIYALGVVLFEMLTGRKPFEGKHTLEVLDRVRHLAPPRPCSLNPQIPDTLEEICLRCLAKNPGERFPSAETLAQVLRALPLPGSSTPTVDYIPAQHAESSTEVVADAPARQPESSTEIVNDAKPMRRPLRWWIPAGAALLILGGVVYVAMGMVNADRKQKSEQAASSGDSLDNSGGGSASGSSGSADAAKIPDPLRVSDMKVVLFARQGDAARKKGNMGEEVWSARLKDQITIEAKLSRPAYAYILVFRADGQVELCCPEDETEVPARTSEPRYPTRTGRFGLQEGTGLWVCAVVASDEPLPSYQDWLATHKLPSWKKENAPEETVWYDDGHWVEAFTPRGPQRSVDRAKGENVPGQGAVARITDGLKRALKTEAVFSVGFPVTE